MKQISSETIIAQKAPSISTGMQPGAHGLVTHESSAAAAWLARRTPSQADEAAVWRASQHGVEVHFNEEARFPEGGGYYHIITGCILSGDADYQALANELKGFITPAPVEVIEGWLAELSVITARRQGDEMEEALRLGAYANRLARYPADVARYVCITKSWKFWPSWFEMEQVCNQMAAARRILIRELEKGPRHQPEPRRLPTPEERARAQQLMREQFPELAPKQAEWDAEFIRQLADTSASPSPDNLPD